MMTGDLPPVNTAVAPLSAALQGNCKIPAALAIRPEWVKAQACCQSHLRLIGGLLKRLVFKLQIIHSQAHGGRQAWCQSTMVWEKGLHVVCEGQELWKHWGPIRSAQDWGRHGA